MLAWLFPLLTGTRSSRCLLCHGLSKRTVGYRLMLALLLPGSFALQHVPTAMNRDFQDTPEVRV
jgi:hypothetical protein